MKTPSTTSPSPARFNNNAVYQPVEDTFLLLQAALAEALPEDLGAGDGSRRRALRRGRGKLKILFRAAARARLKV